MPDVLIVGGGVIGCATAYFLARGGASVVVLERGELASEASGAAAGMLAALSDEGGDRGPAFQRLCLDSLHLYESLLSELEATGVDLRYRRAGVLHVALNELEAQHLHARFQAQRGIAPESAWLNPTELAREEPGVTKTASGGLLTPSEHYVDPQRLTLAYAEGAQRHGAEIRTGISIRRLLVDGNSVTGVVTDAGRVEAGLVLLAAGPWTTELARKLGVNVPVHPIRGQMMSLLGPPQALRHVIWGEHAYLVAREDGQTFVGATVEDVGFRKVNTVAGQARLRRGAAGLVPDLSNAPVLRSWAGLRPATPDALPIMGPLPGWRNAWVSTGHFRNGILLSAISGQLVARSILEGVPDRALEPFSPLRFAEASTEPLLNLASL